MKIIIFITFILFFNSCSKKSSPHCETWLVQDICIPKGPAGFCLIEDTPYERNMCGEDLKDLSEGKEVLVFENENHQLYRRYVRRV